MVMPTYSQSSVITIIQSPTIASIQKSEAITFGDALVIYMDTIGRNLPQSWMYISVKYTSVGRSSPLYKALQKWIMMWLIDNKSVRVNRNTPMTEWQFASLIQSHTAIDLKPEQKARLSKDQLITRLDQLPDYFQIASDKIYGNINKKRPITDISNFGILNDAYIKLTQEYINWISLSPESMIQGAIIGMTDSIGDKHTSYFPPIESQSFSDDIHGQVEGIWAYVEMAKPGVFMIITPLDDSPAQLAWILPGDRIMSIDDLVITDQIDLATAVKAIKGPANTSVTLTILREGQTIKKTVKRAKIHIQAVVYKLLSNNDAYIQVRQFNIGMISEWNTMMTWLNKQPSVRNIILDLRNNPGGSLQDVADVLSTMIPKDKPIVAISFAQGEQIITSDGQISYSFGDKKISILINKGSASAAEILALVLKDYYPQTVSIIGEKSYGKWSVQTIYDYGDGSSIKITIANWFSGKSHISIDGIGIIPDQLVVDDKNTTEDEVLETAKK